MRIYKIEFDIQYQKVYFADKTRFKWIRRPGKPKQPHYDIGPDYDNPMLVFDGKPKKPAWIAPKAFSVCEGPKHLVPTIWEAEEGAFALDDVARERLGPLLAPYGELLPLRYEPQPLVLFHVTRIVDCLDEAQSDRWNRFVFLKSRLADAVLFKTAPAKGRVNLENYALERTGDPDREFKAAVEHHGLTGLVFRPVWDLAEGPIARKTAARARRAKTVKRATTTKKVTQATKATKKKPPAPGERALADDEREEIESCLAEGYKLLDLTRRATPDRVQKAIQAWIDQFRAKKRRPTRKAEDAALALGCLWGQTLCDRLDWEWVAVRKGKKDLYGVVSPKRECLAFPMQHVMMLLTDRQLEANTLLLYNMVKAGEMTTAKPKSYEIIS